MSGSSVIGALRVNLGLDSALFQEGAKRAQSMTAGLQKGFARFGKSATELGQKLSVVSAGIAAVGAAGLALVNNVSKAGTEVSRLSKVAGATPQVFQRWAAGSKKVGIEQDKLADILKDVNDKVGDYFETGGGPMADFFDNIAPKVGITAEAFRGLSGPDALQLYVDSLQKAGLNQQQMTFYMEALASDATGLLPLLLNNGQAMRDYGDAAARSGALMSDKAIAASEDFQHKLQGLRDALTGLKNRIAEDLLPVFTRMVEYITASLVPVLDSIVRKVGDVIQWFSELPPGVQEATAALAGIAAFAGPVLLAIGSVSTALSLFRIGPIGWLIAAATTVATAWSIWGDDVKAAVGAAIDWLKLKFDAFLEFMQGLVDKAVAVKDAIADALSLGQVEMNSGTGYGGMSGAGDAFGTGAFGANPYDYDPSMPAAGGVDGMQSMGAAAAAGFGIGMGRQFNAMRQSFGDYAQIAVDSVKERLGIHSPSRVFQEIGKFITDGLGLGLKDGAPAVGKAMDGVVQAVDGKGDSLSGSMQSFAQAAQSAFQSVLAGTAKLSDALRGLASQWLSSMGSKLLSSGVSGLMSAIGLPSFDGGGYTWDGPRTGGVDGKGGRLGILHPQETVFDHTKGQSAGGGVVQVIASHDPGILMQMIDGRVDAKTPSIVGKSVGATSGAMRRTKAFGS